MCIRDRHGLIDPDKFNFLWVVDFPLFEYSEQEEMCIRDRPPILYDNF